MTVKDTDRKILKKGMQHKQVGLFIACAVFAFKNGAVINLHL